MFVIYPLVFPHQTLLGTSHTVELPFGVHILIYIQCPAYAFYVVNGCVEDCPRPCDRQYDGFKGQIKLETLEIAFVEIYL
jgi:hypothetical protein